MNEKIVSICVALFLATMTNSVFGTDMISQLIEQNGIRKDIQEPLTGNAPIKVMLTDASIKGKWTLEILDRWQRYNSVSGIQSYDGYCTIDPEVLLPLNFRDILMEYDEELNRELFCLKLSFSSDGGQKESIMFNWGLIPTRPVISNIKFTYVYDWEWDDIWPNGSFVFTVESQDAERMEYHVTPSFQFGPPLFFTNTYAIDTPSPATIDYDADWGEFIQVSAANKFGWAQSNIICTTDYITDQDILNRIQDLAGVEGIERDNDNPLVDTANSILSFTESVDVAIHDLSGKKIRSVRQQETVSLSDLQPGIYLISYGNFKKTFNLKFNKK